MGVNACESKDKLESEKVREGDRTPLDADIRSKTHEELECTDY